jgi:hypothetical protein
MALKRVDLPTLGRPTMPSFKGTPEKEKPPSLSGGFPVFYLGES